MRLKFYLFLGLFISYYHLKSQDNTFQRFTRVEAGFAAGVSGDSYFYVANQGLILSVVHGKKWKALAFAGGVGYEAYNDVHFVPIFAELSKPFGKKQNTDFRLRLGYAPGFSVSKVETPEYHFDGGVLLQTGAGFRIFQNADFKIKLWLDYKYQHAQFLFQPFDGESKITTPLFYHFGSLKIGIDL